MNKYWTSKILLLLGILFFGNIIHAATKPITERLPAKPTKLVNNLSTSYPSFLKPDETLALENKLASFANIKGIQISVLIVDDLLDLDPNEYVTRVFNKWGIGEKKTDMGVLLLIKPTQPRDIYIGTGYGSETYLPDASCKQIIEKVIKPNFKASAYYQGLDQATSVMISAFDPNIKKPTSNNQASTAALIFLAIFIFFVMIMIERFGRASSSLTLGPGRRYNRGLDASDIALPLILGSSFGGHHRSGGDFGGGFGGGFGGFGGGMSGGGGAGGSW